MRRYPMIHKYIEKYNALSVQLKATIWFFVCSVLQRGISVITTPIFTRLLSTEEYGQYSVFNSWLSILQIIITLSLTSGVYTMGIVKFKEEEKVFTKRWRRQFGPISVWAASRYSLMWWDARHCWQLRKTRRITGVW